jgi:hypothetical protein
VVLFHVLDHDKEMDFSFDNRPYMFIDLETDEKLKFGHTKSKIVHGTNGGIL